MRARSVSPLMTLHAQRRQVGTVATHWTADCVIFSFFVLFCVLFTSINYSFIGYTTFVGWSVAFLLFLFALYRMSSRISDAKRKNALWTSTNIRTHTNIFTIYTYLGIHKCARCDAIRLLLNEPKGVENINCMQCANIYIQLTTIKAKYLYICV